MKALLTILLTLSLLWSQGTALAQATPVSVAACDGCACNQPDCCVSRTPAPDQPEPAAPATSQVQLKVQWLLATAVNLLSDPAETADFTARNTFASPTADSVPLHLRHCVFLI